MSETTTELPTHGDNLTEVAQTKVRTLLEQEGRTNLTLRITAPASYTQLRATANP